MPGADMPGHCGGHDADRAGAGDQHILAHEVERQRGVHGVAERIEDGAEFVVDIVGQRHDVEGWDFDVFGKRAGNIHADAPGFGIEMETAAARGAAVHADDMTLARNPLTDAQGRARGAQFGDLAGIFVADDHRHRHCPSAPNRPRRRCEYRCRRCRSC